MTSLKLFRKQWIISKTPDLPEKHHLDSFQTFSLGNSLFLHHDRDLTIQEFKQNKNEKWLVLGVTISTPDEDDDVYHLLGRYVVIRFPWLSLDAIGSMGVFYATEESDIICGSSNSLLSHVTRKPLSGRSLKNELMNWDPLPMSRVSGFSKMFVDQELNLINTSTRVVPRKRNYINQTIDLSKKLADEILKTACLYKDIKRPIYLPLTAGHDSRTIFAAFIKAEVPFKTYTFILENEDTRLDAKIASRLSEAFGIEHNIIKAGPFNEDNHKIYQQHSGGYGGDQGITYATFNYYRHIPDNALLVHGSCFEAGQHIYAERFKGIEFKDPKKTAQNIARIFSISGNREINALSDWLQHRSLHSTGLSDIATSFYLDQKCCGWNAENRQEEDLFAFDWVIFANTWRLIDIMISTPYNPKRTTTFQERAMDILVPGISTIQPINPRMTLPHLIRSLLTNPNTRFRARRKITMTLKKLFKQ
ncbi:hypothetical protein QLX67_08865 [Balneolaceae bacterium ANBcel3]|nr:hypothetical protein [Balneolaceae bacterium ANBcel3]